MTRTRPRLRPLLLVLAVAAVAVVAPVGASSAEARTSGVFADDDGSPHEGAIEALVTNGVTDGCGFGEYCPSQTLSRGQMAALLSRALDLPPSTRDWFDDDDGARFEAAANRLADAEITNGCDEGERSFCPTRGLDRQEMAALLVRAFDLPASDADPFDDDDGLLLEPEIAALALEEVTDGCGTRTFCPHREVDRGEMASFLTRGQGLEAPFPPAGATCDPARWACEASDQTHPVVLRWDGIDIRTPSSGTEVIGMHESNHDGARPLATAPGSPVRTTVLGSRGRATHRRSAGDVVSHPEVEVRAPVTGRVKRASTYRLYCRYTDSFAVIEPDGRPGIEVKVLHIDRLQVEPGDRVTAGVTVLARRPTLLPFGSQVDGVSGPADWPHPHVEVVDTSIPDQSSGGGC